MFTEFARRVQLRGYTNMANLIFITHPDVSIDPQIPVERWRLSDAGLARMRQFTESAVVGGVTSVWASAEAKAIEAAGILAARFGIGVQVDRGLGENDRSATGFLPSAEFEAVANAFFAEPHRSVRGWERAIDAQQRVCHAVQRILARHDGGDLAIVAHGAVGTLLLCHCRQQPISRQADQPFQGHYWIAALPGLTIQHAWKPIAPRGSS
jgi:broad specificity phosphatase PhoE